MKRIRHANEKRPIDQRLRLYRMPSRPNQPAEPTGMFRRCNIVTSGPPNDNNNRETQADEQYMGTPVSGSSLADAVTEIERLLPKTNSTTFLVFGSNPVILLHVAPNRSTKIRAAAGVHSILVGNIFVLT